MRIGFVVNDVHTERPQYTTTRLAMAATGTVTRCGSWVSVTFPS